ncbi:hypothetical protein [Sulfurimonas microaerophilic]|uniref:hypothetical protein n=1 Tax=Sulfurimonas microaerophilic TaxID=3058392 RepID=UPI002714ED37|nr:hypothetical protein [Sulfurimonas sp. hsl 1-7]
MKKGIVIFSGFNLRAVVAFIRTLEEQKLPYVIIAKSKDDDIFKTQYKKQVFSIRQKIHLDLNDLLSSIKEIKKKSAFDKCMIAPSTEALNRFILDNINDFKYLNCFIPLVPKIQYEKISNKYSFSLMCKKYGIKVPEEYEKFDNIKLPFVAKPKTYLINGNTYAPMIIRTVEELQAFKLKYSLKDFYFQEYVEGRCIYLLYYFDKKGHVYKLSQENFIQQEAGKSMIYAKLSNFHNHKVSNKFEMMFLQENFNGLVMIELKVQDDNYKMIEANPRFWGPSQLFVDANYNFFEFLLNDYGFDVKTSIQAQKGKTCYFWDDGISKNIENREALMFYNYTREQFYKNIDSLLQCEVFNRRDTIELYGKEYEH